MKDADAYLIRRVNEQLTEMDREACDLWEISDLPGLPLEVRGSLISRCCGSAAYYVGTSLIRCESPIEQLLLLWLGVAAGPEEILVDADWQPFRRDSDGRFSDGFEVKTQAQIGSYRTDFLLSYHSVIPIHGKDGLIEQEAAVVGSVVIECDGHDFHERTKEQAARDRKRDRELSMLGLRVLRFTGSEIWKNGRACAEEAMQHARKIEIENETKPLLNVRPCRPGR